MIRMRGRGRLPTMAPARMPPPQANTMETATSYSVTASAWPYSPASFQPAATVEDKRRQEQLGNETRARQQFPQHDEGNDDQPAQRGGRHDLPHADLRIWRQIRSRSVPNVSPESIS